LVELALITPNMAFARYAIYLCSSQEVGRSSRPPRDSYIRWGITRTEGKKGIFITTGTFSREARDYTSSIDTKIVLIDGNELSRLMVDHGY